MQYDSSANHLLVGYGPYDPNDHINWRWLLAEDIAVAFPGVPHEDEDWWVQSAARYFQANQTPRKRKRRWRFKSYAAIKQAHAIHAGDERTRDILEARLLADEPYVEIEERMNLPQQAIKGYEKLFFDFRHKRDSKMWISQHAIRLDYYNTSPPMLGTVLRKYGYHGGRYLLEHILEFVERFEGDNLAADLPDLNTPEGWNELTIRSFLATELLPKTPENCELILRLRREMQQEQERRKQEAATASSDLDASVNDAVDQAYDEANESRDDASAGASGEVA